ncbi:MAG: potassium-transporting ATPase subunit KdpA [Tepidisphaeraceae bacterium]|jgi:K+-transporting ATPase ATPase A chain
MTPLTWLQLLFILGGIVLITKPMGIYLYHVLEPDRSGGTILDPVLGPIERLLYRIFGRQTKIEQTWWQYACALLVFSLVTMLATYAMLRLQGHLPWHQYVDALSNKTPLVPHLAFNVAASFVTNTNWQSYSGENTMSYFSQMVALVMHHFFSMSVGVIVAAVLVRGIAGDRGSTIGNFWRDMVRMILYLILPICIVYALFLVSQGSIMNFRPTSTIQVLDQSGAAAGSPNTQAIIQGPVASMMSVKMLGTNGGGYFNANASHPFENTTPLTNYIQIMSFISIPAGLCYYLGLMVKNKAHGWAVWLAMFVMLVGGILTCVGFEVRGNDRLAELGIGGVGTASNNNMEGKETRFGPFNSALYCSMTTSTGCGAVISMHDSFTPMAGFVPLLNIELGEVVFGGVGSGLYTMLVFVFVAIFIAGLMVGRTPEYLGKKIEASDVKLASLVVLTTAFAVLVPTAAAVVTQWGTNSMNNGGPHGLSEVLYCFSEGSGNNGSAFAGLNANVPWYDTLLGIVILVGRYIMMIPVIALAGRLVTKHPMAQTAGSFPVTGTTFVVLLVCVVLIVGALTFFPALALGPIVEHFMMHSSKLMF